MRKESFNEFRALDYTMNARASILIYYYGYIDIRLMEKDGI